MIEFKLPDLGEGISEAEILSWLVREGDTVAEHQNILEVETDKAIVPVPSPSAGRVAKVHHPAGARVPVGSVLVTLEPAGLPVGRPEPVAAAAHEHVPAAASEHGNGHKASAAAVRDMVPAAPARDEDAGSVVGRLSADDAAPGERHEVLATPAVRRLARHLGVDLETVRGTGVGGRITEADVRKTVERLDRAETAPAPLPSRARPAGGEPVVVQTELGPVEKRPLRGVRRAIAEHLSKAARLIVPVTIFDDADFTELVRIRAKEEATAKAAGVKLTYLPFVIRAVTWALKAHPTLNSVLDDEAEEIHVRRYHNVGIAVDTPDGLMVPVIKGADRKSILEIAGEIQHLADAAHARSLRLDQLRGGTFTITNVGTIGGTHATPIVNHPEVAILAVGRIKERVVPRDGQIVVRRMAGLSLTFDHRVIDGGEASRFLNAVIRHIEDPDLMLIKSLG